MTSPRRFPPPWQVEQTPGGFKVLDASGQALRLRPRDEGRSRHRQGADLRLGAAHCCECC